MFVEEKKSGEAIPDLGALRVDRILMLADEIEKPTLGICFDMSAIRKHKGNCGTACCIAGHIREMFTDCDIFGEGAGIGVTETQSRQLFTPDGYSTNEALNDRSRAGRVLRHLAASPPPARSKVDWSV